MAHPRASLTVAALALALSAPGCPQPPPGESLLLDVRCEGPITELGVTIAWRHAELGRTEAFAEQVEDLPSGLEGYLLGDGGEPLHLEIEVPAPGFYVVHLVGRSDGEEVFVGTSCHEVRGAAAGGLVSLSRLAATQDVDGDTYPDDPGAYCAGRQALELPCGLGCAGVFAGAHGDCNPPADVEVPEGCPPPPPDEQWHPLAEDGCGNCWDEDCDGVDPPCEDLDGDGYPANLDCDDDDPAVSPEAEEICGNGIDDNCRVDVEGCGGDAPCDRDGDGFPEAVEPGCGSDCDDEDATEHPGAPERCDDTEDNNCNGERNEGCFPDDIDDDGIPHELDCDDCNAGALPGGVEVCGNGVDEDCDGSDLPCDPSDGDGDGYPAAPGGTDCVDGDPWFFPGAPDLCGDGEAQDCVADVPCASVTDVDGDLFADDVDCDDSDPEINPHATEVCDPDGVDEDCDGMANEVVDSEAPGCGRRSASTPFEVMDYENDVHHCGGCRNDCVATMAGDECVGGTCLCGDAGSCGGGWADACCREEETDECRDLTRPESCGLCDRQCRPGEVCAQEGDERPSCLCEAEGAPCPESACWQCCPERGCVDICSDVAACGSCDRDCSAGDRPEGDLCVHGECYCGAPGAACPGDTWCTDATEPEGCGCADLSADPQNCGGCGVACVDKQLCCDGACGECCSDADCGGSHPCCAGVCCSGNDVCVDGACE